MRGQQDVANDESLDNATSGTLRNPRTKATLDSLPREPSTRALTAGFGVAQPFLRARTHVRRARARHSRLSLFRVQPTCRTSRGGSRRSAPRGCRATNGGGDDAKIDLDLLSSFPTARIPLSGALSSTGLSFEGSGQPIAFPELSNIPPLTRSCQHGSDAVSLDSASYAGPVIASCGRRPEGLRSASWASVAR